jgi:Amt family ammonium transporter
MILFVSVIVACMFAMTIADTTETPVVCDSPSQYLDAEKNECIDFTSTKQKASTDFSAELNSGNTAWLLASSAFVMIMTPGVAFFYAGLAGEEMASNTIMMSFVSMAAVSIQFFAFGYSVAFSPNGLFAWAGYNDVTGVPGGVYGVKIPAILFALFQTQFAMITPALLSGGIVGRMKFGTFIVFCLLWTTFVYGPLAHWMWSYQLDDDYSLAPLGWEAKMGSIDFAGGTVIHVSSGFGALVAAIVVGKRYNHGEPVKPHNVPLTMIGCTLLWFGWFGFNGGSAAAADGVASVAAMNTHLAACAGFLTWIGMEFIFDRKIDPCGAASGAVAGLVSITPGCGFVFPWASLIFGIVGAATAFGCVRLKNVLRYDDTLDSFGIHGCAGVMGGLLTGLFATSKINPAIKDGAFYGNGSLFVHQLVSQIIAAAYSAVVTLVILMLLKYTIGLRVSEDKERDGMDLSYHGGTAYASTHGPSSPLKNLAMANPPEGDFASLMSPGASTNPKTENVSANPV